MRRSRREASSAGDLGNQIVVLSQGQDEADPGDTDHQRKPAQLGDGKRDWQPLGKEQDE